MQLRARRSISTCPACGTASRRVHSHYQRKLADLPWEGLPVVILLQARKFFCVGDSCRRKILTEPLPGTVRATHGAAAGSSEALHWLTLALGGRAGARLARRLGLHRFTKCAPEPKMIRKTTLAISAIFSRFASICRGFIKTFHVSGTRTLGTASRSDRSSESH
jgi:transposase